MKTDKPILLRRWIGVSGVITLLTFVVFSFDGFLGLDHRLTDLFQRLREQSQNPSRVVIILLDKDSRKYLNQKKVDWMDPMLVILRRGKARVIAFEQSLVDTQEQRLQGGKDVVLAWQVSQWSRNKLTIGEEWASGFVQPVYDQDLHVRRAKPFARIGSKIYPSFALSVFAKFHQMSPEKTAVVLSGRQLLLGEKSIPLDKESKMLIHFRSEGFPHIPLYKVLAPAFLKHNPSIFSDKIVLVAQSDTDFQETYATPLSRNMEDFHVQAHTIDTLVSGQFLRILPHLGYMMLIFVPTFLLMVLSSRSRLIVGLGTFLLMCVTVVVIAKLAFNKGIILQSVPILASLFLTYFVSMLLRFWEEEHQKQYIKTLFNQYVSPEILRELMASHGAFEVPRVRKDVSILFIDIREFTRFSASRTPEEVIAQLNEFLNAMTEVIFAFGGTIDKYMGDSIMAVWGSPIAQKDYALLAVRAGLEQLKVLEELNKKWMSRGKPLLDVGIGIATGEAVAGSIGADRHKEYTVVGNTVNIAQKIEESTRVVSRLRGTLCRFLICETTQAKVSHEIETRQTEPIVLQGIESPLRLWEVIREKPR